MIGKKRLVVGLVVACVVTFALAVGSVQGMELAVRNASVYPEVGNWSDYFNYSVNVSFYKGIEIELRIYHPGENKWKSCETQEYNASNGTWQTLWWNIQPFSPGCKGKNSSYEFWWNKEVLEIEGRKTFEGPHIKEEIKKEFRKESVNPVSGYYNTPFTYSVEVKLNKEEKIHLEILNISSSEWGEPVEPKNYTGNGTWQTREWPNIANIASADCKGGHSSFRFFFFTESEEKYESDTIDYPIIYPLDDHIDEVIFENANVDPPKGNFSTFFNYTVEVNSGIKIKNVTLEVYNGSWRPIGDGTPKSVGNSWEWKGISVGKGGYEGNAKYRFFCNNNEYNSTIYYGPLLLNEPTKPDVPYYGGGGGGGGSSYKPYMLYENANVNPSDCTLKGAIESKMFYYTVEVDKKDTLILEIYNPSSEEWEEKGKGEKSKLKDTWRHEWTVTLALDKNWAGHGKYRFYPEKKEKYASQVYYGPEIKMPSLSEWKEEIGFSDKVLEEPTITCTVNLPEEKWFKKFTYTAEINHPDRANMTVVLFVYKPGSNEWEPVPWRGDRFNPIIKPSKYLFSIDAVQIEEDLNRYSISEDLKKGFKTKGFILSENATIKKEKADKWEITSGEKIYIVKKEDGKLNIYSSDYDKKGNATVGWAVEKRGVFDEEDAGKSSKFHIWYWDGWNEYNESKGYDNGPTLLVNREPEFKGLLKLAPDPGSTHCIYEYKFGVNDLDGDTVQGLLTVIDPLIEEHVIEGLYKEGNLTFRVGPDLGIFTDLGEYKNFTSSYRLEYWDEGMMVDGKTNQEPKDGWFTGPTVTEVNVTHTEQVVSPNRGTYADEFEYRIKFYSSKDNTISLNLTIYDPSNRSKPWPAGVIDLKVLADKEEPAIWKIKPEVFGPDDFGKTARYTIEYEDSFGNRKILNGSGPSIERVVPVLSWDPPLVPIIPMVMVPFFTFVASLFLRYNLIGRLRRWREEKE